MSDLTEKLEVLFRDPEGLYPVAISREEHQQILSALKTVRGIEGITNTEGNSVTFVHKNADFNGLPNCCIVVTTDWSNEQTYRADTFAECVEAAGKKGEGRDG